MSLYAGADTQKGKAEAKSAEPFDPASGMFSSHDETQSGAFDAGATGSQDRRLDNLSTQQNSQHSSQTQELIVEQDADLPIITAAQVSTHGPSHAAALVEQFLRSLVRTLSRGPNLASMSGKQYTLKMCQIPRHHSDSIISNSQYSFSLCCDLTPELLQ